MSVSSLERLAVLGAISELTEEQQRRVNECIDKMRSLVDEYEELALIGLALIGLEAQEGFAMNEAEQKEASAK